MNKKQNLEGLLAKVKAEYWINGAYGDNGAANFKSSFKEVIDFQALAWDSYNGSMDAANSLHKSVIPQWDVSCLNQASNLAGAPWGCEIAYFNEFDPNKNKKAYSRHNYDNNPARAWLIAILKAIILECE